MPSKSISVRETDGFAVLDLDVSFGTGSFFSSEGFTDSSSLWQNGDECFV
jgi:hypothetical protein